MNKRIKKKIKKRFGYKKYKTYKMFINSQQHLSDYETIFMKYVNFIDQMILYAALRKQNNINLKHYLSGGKEPVYKTNNFIKFLPDQLNNSIINSVEFDLLKSGLVMNKRIKKKIKKRFGYRKFHNYYMAKLIKIINKYRNSDEDENDIVYMIGKNVKHPHKLYLLKNCYPISTNKDQQEKSFSLSFNAYNYKRYGINPISEYMKLWIKGVQENSSIDNDSLLKDDNKELNSTINYN